MSDFEEVTLLSPSDKGIQCSLPEDDGFEEVTLLGKEKLRAAEECTCKCHIVSGRKEIKKSHCAQCGLRVSEVGMLFR